MSAVLLTAPMLFGQEEPLPPVTARAAQQSEPIYVALAVEPMHATETISIQDAARSNDYPAFHALYEQTGNAAYAPLHELWTYAINDPIGAFYGEEMYERFARVYPDFRAYIDDYKIVDDHGNVFYPTAETRAFLLAKAAEGRVVAPSEEIRIAKEQPREEPLRDERLREERQERAGGYSPARKTPRVLMRKSEAVVPSKKDEGVALKPELRLPSAAAPVFAQAPVAPPVPMEIPAAPRAVQAAVLPVVPRGDSAGADAVGRGILLILIGMIGIGFLAMILRTPRGQQPATTTPESPAGDLRKAPR
ncbi:MAG TPA: hypothetical protein VND45_07750 [Thermoanaerobaculia bacterium]|nr:hypothetical protein [Thermoanaerobaculia bacterium]